MIFNGLSRSLWKRKILRASHQRSDVPQTSRELDAVIALWGPNRRTLGFLANGAFSEGVPRRTDRSRDPRRECRRLSTVSSNYSRLAHLDRSSLHRSELQGARDRSAARAVVESGVPHTEELGAVSRRDYTQLRNLWLKSGFVCRAERRGRGKVDCRLESWRWSRGQLDLFDRGAVDRIVVVIDANVFYDLHRSGDFAEPSQAVVVRLGGDSRGGLR